MPQPDLTFEAVTATEAERAYTQRRTLTLPLSVAAHVVVLGALVAVPVLTSDTLPDPATSTVSAFLVEPLAPPPPPPPPARPAAAHLEPSRETPKTLTLTSLVDLPGHVAAPETADDLGLDRGEPGGVEGGAPGGVVGGVVGGLPDAPPPPLQPVRVGGSIKEPKKLKHVEPVYPPVAARRGVQGIVVLECTVSPGGRVVEVKVLQGIPLLDAAAVEAVKQWVFTPTLFNGVPVPAILTVNVRFAL
jgi:protein TonB